MTTITDTLSRRNNDLSVLKAKYKLNGIVCINRTLPRSPVNNPIALMGDDGKTSVEMGSYFHGFAMVFPDIIEQANELLQALNNVIAKSAPNEILELDLFTGNPLFNSDDSSMRHISIRTVNGVFVAPIARINDLERSVLEVIKKQKVTQ